MKLAKDPGLRRTSDTGVKESIGFFKGFNEEWALLCEEPATDFLRAGYNLPVRRIFRYTLTATAILSLLLCVGFTVL